MSEQERQILDTMFNCNNKPLDRAISGLIQLQNEELWGVGNFFYSGEGKIVIEAIEAELRRLPR